MTDATLWLPPGTSFGRLDRRIAQVVHGWSRVWFGGDADIVPGGTQREAVWSKARPQQCGRGGWLLVPDEATRTLGRLALHLEPGAQETEADRATLDSVGADCLKALGEALLADLEIESVKPEEVNLAAPVAGAIWKIEYARSALRLGFLLQEAERAALLLRLMPPAERRPPVVAPDVALAPLEVALTASLGTCGVTLAELRSLSTGDVLVLDRDLSATSPLAIDGSRASSGSCAIAREADRLLLEIAEPIIGRNS
ncbi:hypothetical protein DAH55_13970 [Sphingomonas koreensis]|uniref:FliM/FliN family flagellar motor switch protein n=1 Tax=Sphingomonas koreensis TaxID=93064 RepID=UPI00083262C5|nr:FliM/FliN family flagellar motor switch protein [Sphingomonas koreensis]PJI88456.1 type III flagellar switch regulator (C-ring) FliN [Sphingomonas koreensis]RSU58630.1 hypothetical protein DAH56_14555 [Sphingomonas koreensis]RSU66795.1 hypothetical protein DAH55_13970 [Sphingomonas koreensis]